MLRHKNSNWSKELCRSQQIYVITKTSQNSRLKRAFLVATVMFFVAIELEEDFEESCCDDLENHRDILNGNGEGIVLQHYVLCRNIKVED